MEYKKKITSAPLYITNIGTIREFKYLQGYTTFVMLKLALLPSCLHFLFYSLSAHLLGQFIVLASIVLC